jgi:hypothetical protein
VLIRSLGNSLRRRAAAASSVGKSVSSSLSAASLGGGVLALSHFDTLLTPCGTIVPGFQRTTAPVEYLDLSTERTCAGTHERTMDELETRSV